MTGVPHTTPFCYLHPPSGQTATVATTGEDAKPGASAGADGEAEAEAETDTSPTAGEGTTEATREEDAAAQEESTGDVAKGGEGGEGGEDAAAEASSTRSVAVKIQQVPVDEVSYLPEYPTSHRAALSVAAGVCLLWRVCLSSDKFSECKLLRPPVSLLQFGNIKVARLSSLLRTFLCLVQLECPLPPTRTPPWMPPGAISLSAWAVVSVQLATRNRC